MLHLVLLPLGLKGIKRLCQLQSTYIFLINRVNIPSVRLDRLLKNQIGKDKIFDNARTREPHSNHNE